jgi:hypothetical protein
MQGKKHKSTNMQQNRQPNYNQQHAERNSRGIKQEENKHLERTGLTPQKAKKTPTEGLAAQPAAAKNKLERRQVGRTINSPDEEERRSKLPK